MKNLLLSLLLVATTNLVHTQTYFHTQFDFANTPGVTVTSIDTTDCGVMLAGPDGMALLDYNGDTIRTFLLGQTIMAGSNGGMFQPHMGKLDCSGCYEWVYSMSTSSPSAEIFHLSAATTVDGGYLVVQYDPDIWIGKMDANGDSLWMKRYDHPNPTDEFSVEGIYAAMDSSIYVHGEIYDGINPGRQFILKLDHYGNVIWANTYSNEHILVISETFSGDAMLGISEGSYASVAVLDDLGNIVQSERFGTISTLEVRDLQRTVDGNYLLYVTTGTSGWTQKNYSMIMMDQNLDSLWIKAYYGTSVHSGPNPPGHAVIPLPDTTILVGALIPDTSFAPTVHGDSIYVMKTDQFGLNTVAHQLDPQAVNWGTTGLTGPAPETIIEVPIAYGTLEDTLSSYCAPRAPMEMTQNSMVVTGMAELPDHDPIFIYPNPANDHVTITSEVGFQMRTMKLLDIQGRMVFEHDVYHPYIDTIALPELQTGIYFVEITFREGTVIQRLALTK